MRIIFSEITIVVCEKVYLEALTNNNTLVSKIILNSYNLY